MKKKHFTPEQIAFALRQHEGGTPDRAIAECLANGGVMADRRSDLAEDFGPQALKALQLRLVDAGHRRYRSCRRIALSG